MSWNSSYQNQGVQGAQPAGAYPWGQEQSQSYAQGGSWEQPQQDQQTSGWQNQETSSWENQQGWVNQQQTGVQDAWSGGIQQNPYGNFSNGGNGASDGGQGYGNRNSFGRGGGGGDAGRGGVNKANNRGGNTANRGGNSASNGGNNANRGGNSASRGGNSFDRGGNSANRGGNSNNRGGNSNNRGGNAARGSGRGGSRGGGGGGEIPSLMGGGRGRPRGRGGFGGGMSSLGDLVNIAKHRVGGLPAAIDAWQSALARSFDDSPVSALHSSIAEARINSLFVDFRCNFLCNVGQHTLFSGVVTVNDYFIARGLGASPQACKVDSYGKAFDLLLSTDPESVLSQQDVGEHVLTEEVYRLFDHDPRSFMAMVEDSTHLARGGPPGGYGKRMGSFNEGPDAKRMHWQNNKESLAPTKKIGILMDKKDPIKNKLLKLKELLKEEGITKLHIVPKVDQIAHKTAINIKNVYRYVEVPILGGENKTPTFVEIYFDDVFMARGEPEIARNAAMHNAYQALVDQLCAQSIDVLAEGSRYWHPHMQYDKDISNVVIKWQGDDNNSMLTNNLANMKQMMTSMPDFSIPIEKLVVTEHEADIDASNPNYFKVLELSCTRNLILLECEIIRNPEMTFTCKMSLNGKQLCSRNHMTKNGAKRTCSETIMKSIQKKNDYIYVHKDYMGRTITKQELITEGQKLRAMGHPPSIYVPWEPKEGGEQKKINPPRTPSEKQKLEDDKRETRRIENLAENIALKPLIPYMAAAFYKILDEYFEKVTLEDLIVDTRELARSHFEMITHCAAQMGLRMVNKLRAKTDPHQSLLRRTIKAVDIHKMLQIQNGRSGRYEMKKLVHKTSLPDLEAFKVEYAAKHQEMVVNREDPEKQLAAKDVGQRNEIKMQIS